MRACRSSSRLDGNREVVAGRERSASALQRGCKLEREERVAARGLPESDQRRPRKRRVEAGAQQLVGRAEAQPGDFDRSPSVLGYGAAKPLRHVAADRQQGGDRLTVQAGERVTKRRKRRRVQPLDVVDREADRTVAGEPTQRFEEGGGHGAVIDVDLRLAEQQRDFESLPLDRRQRGDHVARAAEEVGQPRERELGLGLRRVEQDRTR